MDERATHVLLARMAEALDRIADAVARPGAALDVEIVTATRPMPVPGAEEDAPVPRRKRKAPDTSPDPGRAAGVLEAEHPHVWRDPGRAGGLPCIRGTRLTVPAILTLLAAGHDERTLCGMYPELRSEQIRGALDYASRVWDRGVG